MGSWQIGESATALGLDPQGRGEVTFTVTNASTAADRAVLTVHPLDGAADGWFTVTEPMRPVAAGASVVFPVGVAVPSSVAAGTYGVQGVAYSANTDPSETSATSKRVSVTVGAAAAPTSPRLPWWAFAAIGAAVLLVVIVVGVLLLGGDDSAETSAETTTTTSPETTTTTAGGGGGEGGFLDPSVLTIPRPVFEPTTTTAPPVLIEVPDTGASCERLRSPSCRTSTCGWRSTATCASRGSLSTSPWSWTRTPARAGIRRAARS